MNCVLQSVLAPYRVHIDTGKRHFDSFYCLIGLGGGEVEENVGDGGRGGLWERGIKQGVVVALRVAVLQRNIGLLE